MSPGALLCLLYLEGSASHSLGCRSLSSARGLVAIPQSNPVLSAAVLAAVNTETRLTCSAQYEWLQKDLKSYNRTQSPWLVRVPKILCCNNISFVLCITASTCLPGSEVAGSKISIRSDSQCRPPCGMHLG